MFRIWRRRKKKYTIERKMQISKFDEIYCVLRYNIWQIEHTSKTILKHVMYVCCILGSLLLLERIPFLVHYSRACCSYQDFRDNKEATDNFTVTVMTWLIFREFMCHWWPWIYLFVIATILTFPHSWLITEFVTRVMFFVSFLWVFFLLFNLGYLCSVL